MARCGSSAIFEMIKNSCEGEKVGFFELNEHEFLLKLHQVLIQVKESLQRLS